MTDFRFHIPIDDVIEKADAHGNVRRLIGGICSTDDFDNQQERLLQEGLDFAPFLKGGWFNDNHEPSTGGAVGVPLRAELRQLPGGRKGWYVEGELLNNKRAEEIYDLARALRRSHSSRKLGFSVEGSILDRDPSDPKTVRKALVREVAITRCPVNTKTELDLLVKSLSVGSNSPAPPGTVATGDGAGAVLARESLEGQEASRPDPDKKKKKKKYTKSEATIMLQALSRGRLSEAQAARLVDLAFTNKE